MINADAAPAFTFCVSWSMNSCLPPFTVGKPFGSMFSPARAPPVAMAVSRLFTLALLPSSSNTLPRSPPLFMNETVACPTRVVMPPCKAPARIVVAPWDRLPAVAVAAVVPVAAGPAVPAAAVPAPAVATATTSMISAELTGPSPVCRYCHLSCASCTSRQWTLFTSAGSVAIWLIQAMPGCCASAALSAPRAISISTPPFASTVNVPTFNRLYSVVSSTWPLPEADTQAASPLANEIGGLELDAFVNKMAHAMAGCAVGAVSAGSSAGCASGALGAAVGELAAETLGRRDDTVQVAALMAGLAVALAGGDAGQVNLAATAGGNAAANKYLSHSPFAGVREVVAKENARLTALCEPNCTAEDFRRIDQQAAAVERAADLAEVAKRGVITPEQATRLAQTLLELVPVYGSGESVLQLITGQSSLTGEEASRIWAAVGLVPIAGGMVRKVGEPVVETLASALRALDGPIFKTTKEATQAAEALGYRRINETVNGQAVYTNGKSYISRDVDGHNGGAWKEADSVKNLGTKESRNGTFNADLSKRIGD